MIHQEDAGLNAEMAKLAFARGIWSYVRKMGDAVYKYSISHRQTGPVINAVSLIQKVRTFLLKCQCLLILKQCKELFCDIEQPLI